LDRNKFSAIAHRDHAFYNPLSEEKINRVINFLSLNPSDNVIDIGAGKGEFLLRVIEKYHSQGVAIEQYDGFTELLQSNAADRGVVANIEIIQEDAEQAVKTFTQQYKVGVCIGSSHSLGGYQQTIESLKNLVVQGGYIIIGELYWRKKPDQEYLEFLGMDEQDLFHHAETIFTAEEYGLIPLWSTVANKDDFDAYEWLYSKSIEDYCFNNPSDIDCPAMLERIRSWRNMYLKHGRDTLGFGLYLYRNS